MLWANSVDIKAIFSQEKGFDIMEIVSLGDNLLEISNSVFWKKFKKYFRMSSAEIFTQQTMHLCVYLTVISQFLQMLTCLQML